MGPNSKSNLRSDKRNEEEEKEMNLCADAHTKAKLFSVLTNRQKDKSWARSYYHFSFPSLARVKSLFSKHCQWHTENHILKDLWCLPKHLYCWEKNLIKQRDDSLMGVQWRNQISHQKFSDADHKAERRVPPSPLKGYFPIQAKQTLRTTLHSLALRVMGLTEGNIWFLPVWWAPWRAQAVFAALTLWIGSRVNAAENSPSPGWTLPAKM